MLAVVPGIRLATAATAPATTPLTAAVADASRDGSGGLASRRIERLAADRAAFFWRATAPLAARFAAVFLARVRFAAVFLATVRFAAVFLATVRFAAVLVAPVRLAAVRFAALRRGAPLRAARATGFRFFDCFLVVRFAKSPPLATP
jgi:hypothetical protein